MANKLPSFLQGSVLVIKIGNRTIAYCNALSFSDQMDNTNVYGIGSFSPGAIEPLAYNAQGSISIQRYSDYALKGTATSPAKPKKLAAGISETRPTSTDGNSLADLQSFSPALLIIQSTFDIDVYTRTAASSTKQESEAGLKHTFTLRDCRMTSMSMSFSPGQLIAENYSFICRLVQDMSSEATKNNPTA